MRLIGDSRVGGDDGPQQVTIVDDDVVVAGPARSWNRFELDC